MAKRKNKVFEFSVFSGFDILADGDNWLGLGDSFSLPTQASGLVSVLDNDRRLSGDARRNEQGDDRRGQTADITIDGAALHSDAKIYAEQVYILKDQFGNRYRMVEIEVAGQGATDRDDIYTFVGNVPQPGIELTVVGQHNVYGRGISYNKLSGGLNWTQDNSGAITIEAEDMTLRGYRRDDVDAASGGKVVKLKRGEGEAALIFGADSGSYALDIAYIDENDGEGRIELLDNGVVVQTIDLTANGDGNGNDQSSISALTVSNLNLTLGDHLVLRGYRDGAEFARIDALTFRMDQAPEATDDAFALDEDTALAGNVLANDLDPAGQGLTATVLTGPANGVLVLDSDGNFAYQPDPNFNGTDQFTYQVSGSGGTDTATVTLVVAPVNDEPLATDISLEGDEDAPVSGNLLALSSASDVDGDTLTLLAVTDLATTRGGRVTIQQDGAFDYVPAADFNGEDTFTFTVIDGNGGQITRSATIDLRPVNDAPVAGTDRFSINEDNPILLDPAVLISNDTDVDGDALTFAGFTSITNGRIDTQPDGRVLFTPTENFSGVIELQYFVRDTGPLFAPGTVVIDVAPVNDAPIVAASSFAIAENSAAGTSLGLLSASDVEGDPITNWTIVGGNTDLDGDGVDAFAIDAATGLVSVADSGDLDFERMANFSLSVTASDGSVTSDSQTVEITLTDVYDELVTLEINPQSTNPDGVPDEAALFNFYAQTYRNFAQKTFRESLGTLDSLDREPGPPLVTPGSSSPDQLTVIGRQLFFSAFDGVDRQLWRFDHDTGALTEFMLDSDSSNPVGLTAFDDKLYFSAEQFGDRELWSFDPATEALIRMDVNPSGSSYPLFMTEHDGALYFAANGADGTRQLWRLDAGSAVPVEIRIDAVLDPDDPSVRSDPQFLTSFDGALYFQNGGTSGLPGPDTEGALWRLDPTGPTRLDALPPPSADGEVFALNSFNVLFDYATSSGSVEIDGTRYFTDLINGQREIFIAPEPPAQDISAPIELSEVQRDYDLRGYVINGAEVGDRIGHDVAGLGDVNGDGFDDITIFSLGPTENGIFQSRSHIVYGKADGIAVELGDITSTGLGKEIVPNPLGPSGGTEVLGALGDVNGDGFDDVAVAYSLQDLGRVAFVVYGTAGTSTLDLQDIQNGIGGFTINGGPGFQAVGRSIAGAGDVNGDGYDDIILGAFRDPGFNENGSSFVVYGGSDLTHIQLADLQSGVGGFEIHGVAPVDNSGVAVSTAGDANGDGFDDVLVGSSFSDINGNVSGQSHIVFGGNFTGAATQVGAVGNDELIGTLANDALFGGMGDDTLIGNGLSDRLSGGQGNDTFVFGPVFEAATILDFDDGVSDRDVIDVSALMAQDSLRQFPLPQFHHLLCEGFGWRAPP